MSIAIALPPAVEVVRGGRVKGGVLKSHLRWLRETRTPAEQREVLDRLTPQLVVELSDPILGSHWYSFATLIALDRAIADVCGDEALEALGQASARIHLDGVFRNFMTLSPHQFLRQSALVHAHYQDFGSATYEKRGDAAGTMLHRNYRCHSLLYCASARGYYAEALRIITKSDDVHVREWRCQCHLEDACAFELRW